MFTIRPPAVAASDRALRKSLATEELAPQMHGPAVVLYGSRVSPYTLSSLGRSRADSVAAFFEVGRALCADLDRIEFGFSSSASTSLDIVCAELQNDAFAVHLDTGRSQSGEPPVSYACKLAQMALENLKLSVSARSPFAQATLVLSSLRPPRAGIDLEAYRLERSKLTGKQFKELALRREERASILSDLIHRLGLRSLVTLGPMDSLLCKVTEGVVVRSNPAVSIRVSWVPDDLGAFWLHMSPISGSVDEVETTFRALRAICTNADAEWELLSTLSARDAQSVLRDAIVPISNISTKVGRMFALDWVTAKRLVMLDRFDGTLTLDLPYSFENSLSDSLRLTVQGERLSFEVRAAMTSPKTRGRFEALLSKRLGREVRLDMGSQR